MTSRIPGFSGSPMWGKLLCRGVLGMFLAGCGISTLQAQRSDPNEIAPGVIRIGAIEHFGLVESSGLAASPRNPGVFWTHNDTEDPHFLFAMTREGRHLGAYEVQGIALVDWEAIATDAEGWIYFADTGTDGMVRSHSAIHRVAEPDVDQSWGAARVVETWLVRFPTAREDCEAFFIHDGWGYLVGKFPLDDRVPLYRFSLVDDSESILLELVTRIPVDGEVSGADLSADGERLALVTKEGITVLFVEGNLAGSARAPRRTVKYENPAMEGGTFVPEGVLVTMEGLRDMLLFTSPFLSGAPVFATNLEDAQAFVGDRLEFSATAAAFPAASYQWLFNGQPIPGATGPTLILSNLTLSGAGLYEVVASNPHGVARTSAVLTVNEVTVDVRVTEVMSLALPETPGAEDWWELTSFDSRTNDLSGWRFNESTGDLADAFVFPEGLLIRPGETIIFVENLTPEEFRGWWGGANIPLDVQIVTFTGQGLSFSSVLGDSVRLWDRDAVSVTDLAARVEFAPATAGVSFTLDPATGNFGVLSQADDEGVFTAPTGEIGSPGFFQVPADAAVALEAARAGDNLEIRLTGEPGPGYVLEVTDHLGSGVWIATGEEFQETNVISTSLDAAEPGTSRFFRVRRHLH